MFENQPALNPEQVQMLMAALKKLQSESEEPLLATDGRMPAGGSMPYPQKSFELPAELALQSGRHRR